MTEDDPSGNTDTSFFAQPSEDVVNRTPVLSTATESSIGDILRKNLSTPAGGGGTSVTSIATAVLNSYAIADSPEESALGNFLRVNLSTPIGSLPPRSLFASLITDVALTGGTDSSIGNFLRDNLSLPVGSLPVNSKVFSAVMDQAISASPTASSPNRYLQNLMASGTNTTFQFLSTNSEQTIFSVNGTSGSPHVIEGAEIDISGVKTVGENCVLRTYLETDGSNYRQLTEKTWSTNFDNGVVDVILGRLVTDVDFKLTISTSTTFATASTDIPYRHTVRKLS